MPYDAPVITASGCEFMICLTPTYVSTVRNGTLATPCKPFGFTGSMHGLRVMVMQ
jgi:hypothetical protein